MEEVMPRPYSDGFILGLDRADETKVGVQLAKVCLKANLPIKYVAEGLAVSRMTLHTWFRGGILRQQNREKVEKFMGLVEQGLADGTLPASNLATAKVFIESDIRPVL
jgi:hypothetical protein|tara:strand:- start:1504 stop:1827 length:324 start_codon:yes stop_codon:yes gene_type:complete